MTSCGVTRVTTSTLWLRIDNMGALDDIAAALRQRTGTRVYGTPNWQDELAKREQEARARDLGLETSQFELESKRQMLPGQLAAQEALTKGREASAELTGARTENLEYQNTPEYRQHALDRENAIMEMKRATNVQALMAAQKKLELSDAQIENLKKRTAHVGQAPPPRPGAGTNTVTTDQGVFVVDRATGSATPVKTGEGQALMPRSSATEREKLAVLEGMMADVDRLEQLAGGPAGQVIGPVAGRFAGATRGVLEKSPEVNDLFHIADNLADQLLRVRSGAAITEKEYARLRKLVPNPRENRAKFDADLQRYKVELQNAIAARTGTRTIPATGEGGIDPEVDKRLKALGY